MKHRPVVTNFEVRKPTYPDGHWMNRYWGGLVRMVGRLIRLVPCYRFVLRAPPATRALLESNRPVIFACVHQDILDCFNGLPRLLLGRKLVAMSSPSRDGALASILLKALGYDVVRGSSARRGPEALIQMRNRMREGASALFACDGPKAPLGDVKPGVVFLARGAGVPIIPVRAWGTARVCFLRSWTKLALSVPMLPVGVFLGEPIEVGPKSESSRPVQLELARSLADLARRASVWAGGPPVSPFRVAKD